MAYDYYKAARELAAAIESEGMRAQAESIREVIAAGMTSTEILMGLRWNLEKMDKAGISDVTGARLQELLSRINAALQP